MRLQPGVPSGSFQHIQSAEDSAFGLRSNKRDKRSIKHYALLARVREGAVEKRKPKSRRRPSRKLQTDVGDLAAALPDIPVAEKGADEEWEGISEEDAAGTAGPIHGIADLRRAKRRNRVATGGERMTMKSLRHRPGAMKRKARMELGEMERFKRNLAQMVGRGPSSQERYGESKVQAGNETVGETAGVRPVNRWASLRQFIQRTMQTEPAFTKRQE
ncbi:hypothetical protein M433DRAFT_136781 [Acidomyces richmondensis BFW]|nr:MAG: hypothetical protein FE78DRAFT_82527 [Acidomyces sp. 'richmondensis']KYG43008.1 hypothetical protein M433DRAFT_136781 [Acidomyces richmondensis BFW]